MHLKHLVLDVLVGDLGLEVDGLVSLGLKEDSLEGNLKKDFLFPQDFL